MTGKAVSAGAAEVPGEAFFSEPGLSPGGERGRAVSTGAAGKR